MFPNFGSLFPRLLGEVVTLQFLEKCYTTKEITLSL